MTPSEAKAELAKRELSRRHLLDFILYNFPTYQVNWHHREIIEALEEVERGETKRLMILMPPRHGKSEICSIQFPAWYLGKHPEKEIIAASYNADLAVDFGKKTRNLVKSREFTNVFTGTELSEDSSAAGKWNTNKGGAYLATGIGGGMTGRGCFPAGTLIKTDVGEVPIEDCNNGTRVLSFNHDKNLPEWKNVVAKRVLIRENFRKITSTFGNSVLASTEHPFFTPGKGYVEAENLREGQGVWVLEGAQDGYSFVYVLWKRISKGMVRIYQKGAERTERLVLWKRMFGSSSRGKMVSALPNLQTTHPKQWSKVLFPKMYSFMEKTTEQVMPGMWNKFYAIQQTYQVLFNGLQKQLSLEANVYPKPELQTRNGIGSISARISKEKVFIKKRPHAFLCDLLDSNGFNPPSQGLQSQKQYRQKPSNGLPSASRHTPQVKDNSISSITSHYGERVVYDLQVDGNHNYFANGFLVHNCDVLLLDDPVKDRADAESELIQNSMWDWYRSTARTRLNPGGAIILIQTRWTEKDLAGRIMEEGVDKWKIIRFPAVAEENEKHRGKGDPLWPEIQTNNELFGFSLEALREIEKDLGPYDWSALYQQSPIDIVSQEFKKHWFKPISEMEVEKKNTNKYLTIDTAISQKSTADFTAFCHNEVDSENYWHLKNWKSRITPHELIENLFALHRVYHYTKIGIEKTIYLDALKGFINQEQRKRGIFLPIVELKHNRTAKATRIRGLIPRYSSGSIFHMDCMGLERELLSFPTGRWDDEMDCTAYQLQVASARIKRPHQEETSSRSNNPV